MQLLLHLHLLEERLLQAVLLVGRQGAGNLLPSLIHAHAGHAAVAARAAAVDTAHTRARRLSVAAAVAALVLQPLIILIVLILFRLIIFLAILIRGSAAQMQNWTFRVER